MQQNDMNVADHMLHSFALVLLELLQAKWAHLLIALLRLDIL